MLTAALLAWLWLGASPTMPAMPIDSFDQTPLGDDWPNWGAPFGPAASAVRLAVVDGDRFHAGRLRYAGAHRHLMLPCPDRPLHGQPLAVTLRVCGDGSRNLLSANLLDASGEWLNSQPVRLDWTGWRAVRLDLTKFRSHGLGDGNGQVDLPARLFSLNLEFVGRSDGELLLDDIAVQQQPAPLIAFLAVSLDRPNRAPLYLPGEAPPALAVTNRGRSSTPVRVLWSLGGQRGNTELLPAPGQTLTVHLPAAPSGPHEVQATLKTDDGERAARFSVAFLPPRVGGPDTFVGLGDHDADEVRLQALLTDLSLIRAAGADWTLLSLPQRRGEPLGEVSDRRELSRVLTLAWGAGLRVLGYLAPSGLGGGSWDDDLSRLESWLGDGIRGWLLPPPSRDPLTAAARVAAARRRLLQPKVLLSDELAADGADGVMISIEAPRPPIEATGGPLAWRKLRTAAAAGRGQPVWLWGRTWPLADLTGQTDRAAAVVITVVCARATPNVVALGWGRLRDEPGHQGLIDAQGHLRPELLALAVADALLGGLACHGLRSPQADVYVADFAAGTRQVQVAWSERGAADLPVAPGQQVFDVLGRRQPTNGSVSLGRAPCYLVSD